MEPTILGYNPNRNQVIVKCSSVEEWAALPDITEFEGVKHIKDSWNSYWKEGLYKILE